MVLHLQRRQGVVQHWLGIYTLPSVNTVCGAAVRMVGTHMYSSKQRLAPDRRRVDPFSPDSPIKKCGIQKFPPGGLALVS